MLTNVTVLGSVVAAAPLGIEVVSWRVLNCACAEAGLLVPVQKNQGLLRRERRIVDTFTIGPESAQGVQ